MTGSAVLIAVGYILVGLGLAGSVIPVLPGPLLIWLGALVWAWGDGFNRIGWPTLLVLGVLAVAAWGVDLVLTAVIGRKTGTSWRAIGGSIVGGIAGGILLSGTPPLLGTLLGATVGAMLGMWAVEYYDKRDRQAATRAVRAYLSSMVVAAVVEVAVALVMISIFAWQAFM